MVMIPKVSGLLVILIMIGFGKKPTPIKIVWRRPRLRQTIRARFGARTVQMGNQRYRRQAAKRTGVRPFQRGIDRHPIGYAIEAIDIGHGQGAAAIDFEGRTRQSFEATLPERITPKARGKRCPIGTIETEGANRFSDGEPRVRAGGWPSHSGKIRVERVDERIDELANPRWVKRRRRQQTARSAPPDQCLGGIPPSRTQ